MGHEDQGRAPVALEGEEQVDDGLAGSLVEIAGRLVRHQDRRIRHDGAGDRHALLLAARKLRRIMVQAMAEADRLQLGLGPLEGLVLAGELEGQRHVLQGRHGRDEVEGLEHDADPPAAKARERILVEAARDRCRRRRSGPNPGRSSPAMVMSRVDLPEPEGPTRPTASPRRYRGRCP